MTGLYRKICAVFTVFCFLLTMSGNVYGSVSDNMRREDRYVDVDLSIKDKSVIGDGLGKISSVRDFGSDIVVVNIQDLHCDYSVQKNISGIIKELADRYGAEKIYVEGGVGEIKTDWINLVKEQSRGKVLDNLVKMGRLSGAELYAIESGNKVPLYGLEQEKIYSKNIDRYRVIKAGSKEDEKYIVKIDREIEYLRAKYLNGANRKFSEIADGYSRGEISQDRYFAGLIKYLEEAGISVRRYPNISRYLGIYDGNKEIEIKRVVTEMRELTELMRETITFSRYKEIMDKTDNLRDLNMFKQIAEKFCLVKNIDFKKQYPSLSNYFDLKSRIGEINQAELLMEERRLVADIRAYLSKDKTDLEISYISDFSEIYKKYIRAELTAAEWGYFKVGFDKFRQLYAKYSINNEVDKMSAKYDMLDEFYKVNSKRDEIFAASMNLEKAGVKSAEKDRSAKEVLEESKNLIILVTGGFHSSGMDKILSDNNITAITVTPNLGKVRAEQAREKYESIMNQRKIQTQTIALKLLSNEGVNEQTKQIILSMLMERGSAAEVEDISGLVQDVLSKETTVTREENGTITINFEDGRIINIEGSQILAKEIDRQSVKEVPQAGREIVRVAGEDLKALLGYFEGGKGIFAPEVYQICKGLCIFAVNNKWYLGDGAIWDIEQARRNGDSELNLDGIEPVVYEYMPGFMQQGLMVKEEKLRAGSKAVKAKESLGKRVAKTVSKAIQVLLVVVMLCSATACNVTEKEPVWPQVSQYTITAEQRQNQLEEVNAELPLFEKFDAADGIAGDGKYNSFLYDSMSSQNKSALSEEDARTVKTMRNLYDQALVALNLMEDFKLEEARQVLRAISAQENLYKSNLEERVITGEVLWVGIAARQYKLLTMGSTEFDDLIVRADRWIEIQTVSEYLFGNSSWNWVSTEHMIDAISYLRLKLYTDELYGEVGMERDVAIGKIRGFTHFVLSQLYNKETNSFYRGYHDQYEVLDINTWGIQYVLMLKTTYPELYDYDFSFAIKEDNKTKNIKDIDIDKVFSYIESNFRKTVTINGHTYENLYMAGKESNNPVMFEWSRQVAGSYRMAADVYMQEGNEELAKKYYERADAIEKDLKAYAVDLGMTEGYPYADTNGALIYQDYGWKGFTVSAVAPLAQPSRTYFTQIMPIIPESYTGDLDIKIKTYENGYKEYYLLFNRYSNEKDQAYIDMISKLDSQGIKYYSETVKENGKKVLKLYLVPTDYRLQNSGLEWPGIILKPNSILPKTLPAVNSLIEQGKGSMLNIMTTILKRETMESVISPGKFIAGHKTELGRQGASSVVNAVKISAVAGFFGTFGALGTTIIPMFSVPVVGFVVLAAVSLLAAAALSFSASVITHTIIDIRYIKSLGLEDAIKKYGRENVKLTEEGITVGNPADVFKMKYIIDKKPVYVITEEPADVKEYNFKPIPVNFVIDGKKVARTWLGNKKGAAVLYVEWLRYDDIIKKRYEEIVRMLQETRFFADRYGADASAIEIDFKNADRELEYSQSGNVIIGVNKIQRDGKIDSKMVIALLENERVDAVTISRNTALEIDVFDGINTYDGLEKFIAESKKANMRLIFSDEEFEKVLELIGSEMSKTVSGKKLEQAVAGRFMKLTQGSKQAGNNLDITVRYSSLGNTDKQKETRYGRYGITSFIFDSQFGSKYYDMLSGYTSNVTEIADLKDIKSDGNMYVIKLSKVVKEIKETSSIFAFLKSINIKEILKEKNVNFVKQAARNFEFDEFPQLDNYERNNIADIIRIAYTRGTQYQTSLARFFGSDSPIVVYMNSLKNIEMKNAFALSVLERALMVDYLKGKGKTSGFVNKSHEELLTNMLVKKLVKEIDNETRLTDVELSLVSIQEMTEGITADDLTISERQIRLNNKLVELQPYADDIYALKFGKKSPLANKETEAKAINGIIELLTLYSDEELKESIKIKTDNIEMSNFKAVLSAA